VLDVRRRDDDAFVTGEPAGFADVEEAFDLSLTAPIACTSPNWLTDPVTANDCRMGASARDEMSAQSSASDALSPSTSP